MIGDSSADYDAAINNNISFLLRKTSLNKFLQKNA
jgi:phosphoglycolate phosphatase-like HAD superfamily hydrolase